MPNFPQYLTAIERTGPIVSFYTKMATQTAVLLTSGFCAFFAQWNIQSHRCPLCANSQTTARRPPLLYNNVVTVFLNDLTNYFALNRVSCPSAQCKDGNVRVRAFGTT